MNFFHYSEKELILENMVYDQFRQEWQAKPVGLWISVEDAWKEWCENENYCIEKLKFKHQVILKQGANILYLNTAKEIADLSKRYPYLRDQWNDGIGRKICSSYEIDWLKVKSEYQGIIISPYQWDCRLLQVSCWYYGWDCASGCIWDLSCIESFTLVEQEERKDDLVQAQG